MSPSSAPSAERTSGFLPATEALLEIASRLCGQHGVQLTDLRRLVLGLVLESPRPVGAYDLLDRLKASRRGAAPPTVYRALDFLLAQGLIHKVERLAAFVACTHALQPGHEDHEAHAVQFLICRRCGTVTELSDRGIGRALDRAAQDVDFAVSGSTVEAEGLCGACARGDVSGEML